MSNYWFTHLSATLPLWRLSHLNGLKPGRQVYTQVCGRQLLYWLLLCLHDVRQRSIARLCFKKVSGILMTKAVMSYRLTCRG